MSVLPSVLDFNSPLSQIGRRIGLSIMGYPDSAHISAAGVVHGGSGGKFGSPDVVLDPNSPTNQPNNPQAQSAPAAAEGLPPEVIDYLYADLAKHYGMSKETAYQEALANTSYQRAMKDMKDAGLNPAAIFGAGKGSGADGVSYVSSASSAGSGGSTARSTSKNNDNLFSSGAYYGLSAGIGLLAGILTKSPTGYWIGSSATQGILGAMNSAYQSRK